MGEDVREVLTWEQFGRATRELAATIARDGFRPDIVLAVARAADSRSRVRSPTH